MGCPECQQVVDFCDKLKPRLSCFGAAAGARGRRGATRRRSSRSGGRSS